MDKLHSSNRSRLQTLFKLAQTWLTFAPLVGSYLVEIIPSTELTIMDMLCEDDPTPMAFTAAYERLAAAISPTIRAAQYRGGKKAGLKQAINTLRGNVNNLGMDLS